MPFEEMNYKILQNADCIDAFFLGFTDRNHKTSLLENPYDCFRQLEQWKAWSYGWWEMDELIEGPFLATVGFMKTIPTDKVDEIGGREVDLEFFKDCSFEELLLQSDPEMYIIRYQNGIYDNTIIIYCEAEYNLYLEVLKHEVCKYKIYRVEVSLLSEYL